MKIIKQQTNDRFEVNNKAWKFRIIAFLVFKLQSGKDFAYKQKRQ